MLECKVCNYKTERLDNYERHNSTKKHLDKINVINDNNTLYKCEKCNKVFKRKWNLTRHNENHKNINLDTDKIINKVDDIINKTNQNNQRIEKKIDKAVKSASALIRYLLEHHKNAPVLKAIEKDSVIKTLKLTHNVTDEILPQIESESEEETNLSISEDDLDEDCKKYYRNYKKNMLKLREEKKDKKNKIKEKLFDDPNKFKLQKEIIKDYKSESIIKYICDIILKNIKKDDVTTQSVFNTDYSRLNYAIKISKRKWDEDKAGSRFIELVIKPTLKCINNLLDEYRLNLSNKYHELRYDEDVNDTEEFKNIFQNMILIYEIQAKISSTTTLKQIIKELAPNLRLIINDNDDNLIIDDI